MKGLLNNDHDRAGLIELLNKLDLSKPYSWEVKRKVKRRTISQNSLYWLWLTCIQEETGNARDDLHEYFKGTYLLPKYIDAFGENFMIHSTKGLTTAQFKEYLDMIQASMAQEGIALPTPDDLIFDSFVEHYSNRL